MRSISSCHPLQNSVFVQGGERELFSCEVRTKIDVGVLVVGCAFLCTCYLVRGHLLNVSDDIKRLLFLFIKQWLKRSQKTTTLFLFSSDSHPFSLTRP